MGAEWEAVYRMGIQGTQVLFRFLAVFVSSVTVEGSVVSGVNVSHGVTVWWRVGQLPPVPPLMGPRPGRGQPGGAGRASHTSFPVKTFFRVLTSAPLLLFPSLCKGLVSL